MLPRPSNEAGTLLYGLDIPYLYRVQRERSGGGDSSMTDEDSWVQCEQCHRLFADEIAYTRHRLAEHSRL